MPFFNNKYRTESNRLQNWNYSSKGIYFLTICSSNREAIFGSIKDSKMNLSQQGKIVLKEIQKSMQMREDWIFHSWVIMPNHIHFLIEIKKEFPKWNFSTIKILDDTVDIECRKLFLNSAEMHCSASLPHYESENIQFKESVETNCSASLPIDSLNKESLNDDFAETHIRASLPQYESENIQFKEIAETHSSASLPIDGLNKESLNDDFVETHSSASLPINFKRTPKSISSFVAQFKAKTTKMINYYDKYSVGSVWQNNYYDRIIWSEEEFKSVYYYIKNNPKNWDSDDLNKL